MNIVILGTSKQALSLGLICKNVASSICFYHQDNNVLSDLKEQFEKNFLEPTETMELYHFSSHLTDKFRSAVIFDFLPECDQKQKIIQQINAMQSTINLYFTVSKLHSVSQIASQFHDPKPIVGLQYLLSFEKTKIVELVKGMHTSPQALERAEWFMNELGKETVHIKDVPGNLLNRMALVLINEATHLLNEGVASPSDIDREMELALGLEMGPLRLADIVGLDSIQSMLFSLYQGTGNPKYLPCSLLQNMVYSGFLGRKTNSGFYSYSTEILNFPALNSH